MAPHLIRTLPFLSMEIKEGALLIDPKTEQASCAEQMSALIEIYFKSNLNQKALCLKENLPYGAFV